MSADGQSQVSPSREARLIVWCGLVVLYGGLFTAVFSDNRLSTFLGVGAAVAGELMDFHP